MLIFNAGDKLMVSMPLGPGLSTFGAAFGMDIDGSGNETFGCLGQTALDDENGGSGPTPIFTVPAGHTYLVKTINLSHTNTISVAVRLHRVPSGTTFPSAGNAISSLISMQPSGLGVYESGQGWRFFNKNQALAGATVIGAGLELLGATQIAANSPYTETVKFTPRDSLLLFIRIAGFSANDLPALVFNGRPSGYWSRYLTAGAGGTTLVNNQNVTQAIARIAGSNTTTVRSFTVYISNLATASKVGVVNAALGTGAAGTAAAIEFGGFEWVETTKQISEIQMVAAGGNNMLTGSAFEVYGINYS